MPFAFLSSTKGIACVVLADPGETPALTRKGATWLAPVPFQSERSCFQSHHFAAVVPARSSGNSRPTTKNNADVPSSQHVLHPHAVTVRNLAQHEVDWGPILDSWPNHCCGWLVEVGWAFCVVTTTLRGQRTLENETTHAPKNVLNASEPSQLHQGPVSDSQWSWHHNAWPTYHRNSTWHQTCKECWVECPPFIHAIHHGSFPQFSTLGECLLFVPSFDSPTLSNP